jgi:hypothetical protein
MSRGKKAIAARVNFSGLSNVISGVTMGVAGFVSTDAVLFEQKSGYQIFYNAGVIEIPQLATGVSLGSWTSVKCWIWGD